MTLELNENERCALLFALGVVAERLERPEYSDVTRRQLRALAERLMEQDQPEKTRPPPERA